MSLDDILTKNEPQRESSHAAAAQHKKAFPVWLIPVTIILGFALLFLAVLWPQLKPALPVQTEQALPLLGQASSSPGTEKQAPDSKENTEPVSSEPSRLLFQAAGWLEPNPLPERISSLVSGTIGKTYVTDGDKVTKGQLLAELVDSDYSFALKEAKAKLDGADADIGLRQTEVETAGANIRMDEANIEAAQARLQNLKDTHERYSKLAAGVISEQAVIQARQELRQQEALVNVAEAKRDTSKTGLHESEARLKAAEAARENALVGFLQAKLNLERCKIYAPITGRVLKMLATPGSRLNVDSDQIDASTLAHLYDPQELALRMDVPIEQAGNVFLGQPSQVRCAIFPDKIFTGEVVRIAGEADIQRNALQVRIRLNNPDDMLRPSMPCRAEVYSKPVASTAPATTAYAGRPTAGGASEGALIPEKAVLDKDNSPHVWVIGLDGKAAQRPITLSPSANREGYLAISQGVFPGEPVIINPPSDLKERDSVKSETL